MNFTILALLVAVGLAGPFLAAIPKFGPPLVVGEILAGLIIGRSGLNLLPVSDPTLALLSSIGFALLMLIVGTHLPFRQAKLRASLGKAAVASVTTAAAATAIALSLAGLIGIDNSWMLVVLLSTSSAAIALPVLEAIKTKKNKSLASAILVTTSWIAIADVATVVSIPLVMRSGSFWSIILGIFLVALVALIAFVALRAARATRFGSKLRKLSKNSHWALDLRVSLLILFVLGAISVAQNTSVLIAGFAAGAALAYLGEPRRLAQQLIGLGEGFLVPLFFVTLGAKLDLSGLFQNQNNLLLAAVLIFGGTVAHAVGAKVTGLPFSAGLIATAQLGVPAAVASVGLQTGMLTAGQAAAILFAVLVSLLVGSIGSNVLGRSRIATVTEAVSKHPVKKGKSK